MSLYLFDKIYTKKNTIIDDLIEHYVWNNINELFEKINKKCNYIILRNYEELSDDKFYCSGHADIDFLTDNVSLFDNTMKAYLGFLTDDSIHYLVDINGEKVIIEVTSMCDNYCINWENEMLKNRINNWYL